MELESGGASTSPALPLTFRQSAGIGVAPTVSMSNFQYGVMLGCVAMAIAAWKFGQSKSVATVGGGRGEVIFSNTPKPSEP